MTATVTPLACQEVATRVATSDRVGAADWILVDALARAAEILSSGAGTAYYRFRRAELLLERETARAARVLGSGGGR